MLIDEDIEFMEKLGTKHITMGKSQSYDPNNHAHSLVLIIVASLVSQHP